MFKETLILLAIAFTAYSAEVANTYSLLEKHAILNPEAMPIETRAVSNKQSADDVHPVFRGEGRARIEMVKPNGPAIVNHEMLADQPAEPQQHEVNRIDNLAIPNYAYLPAQTEVAYPDVPYAPGYGYESNYGPSNHYDAYGNSLSNYVLEPDTSAFGLLWSQMPDSRAIVGFVGRTIAWVFNSMFVILLGSFLTVGFCSYSNLCTINFHGVGPIHEEMRSLMSLTPEKLEKISNAAEFVKSAIDKYQKIQKVTDDVRHRRSIFA